MSLATLIRRGIKVGGRTTHSGRGFYWMELNDCTWEQLKEKIQPVIDKLQSRGLVRRLEVTEDKVLLVACPRQFGYYNVFEASKKSVDEGKNCFIVMSLES